MWKPRGGTPRRTRWQEQTVAEVREEREDRLAREAEEYLRAPKAPCGHTEEEHRKMAEAYGIVLWSPQSGSGKWSDTESIAQKFLRWMTGPE